VTYAATSSTKPPFGIPPGKLVTIDDPNGNFIGLIDNTKGGMPGQRYG
jgi:hypothetical protein